LISGDASESGSIVTAPRRVEQKGRNGTWRVLAKLSVSSEPGNERIAMERVAEVVKEIGLSEQRLERLKTAVAEATMNAIEHGNRRLPEVPVVIEVLSSGADLSVRINDQAGRVADVPRVGSVSDQEHGRRDAHNRRRSPPHCRAGHAPGRRRRCRLNNGRGASTRISAWTSLARAVPGPQALLEMGP
jgi:hypothetical protein